MMASYQDIMTSKPAISQAACASPSLTIMRADMIAALQNKSNVVSGCQLSRSPVLSIQVVV